MSEKTSHDRLFKEFFQRFLPQFLRLFYPEEAARLDFSTLRFLNQELIINLPDTILRIPDVVAEIETWEGESEAIILHIEIEANRKATLPQRMFEYFSLLHLFLKKPVFPIAFIMIKNAGGLCWQQYEKSLFGHSLLQFRYAQVGIRDLESETYLQANDPIAATLAALMQSQSLQPAEVKLASWRSLIANQGLTDGDKLFLINLVETYLPQAENPHARYLLIDNSNSMFERNDQDRLRIDAARLLITYLGSESYQAQHQVGVIFFGSNSDRVPRLTTVSRAEQLAVLQEKFENKGIQLFVIVLGRAGNPLLVCLE